MSIRRKKRAHNPTVKPLPTTPPAVRSAAASTPSIPGAPLDERATAYVLHYYLVNRGV